MTTFSIIIFLIWMFVCWMIIRLASINSRKPMATKTKKPMAIRLPWYKRWYLVLTKRNPNWN